MDLLECRERLNAIDGEIVKLFVERSRVVDTVSEVKSKTNAPVRDEARENAMLARLSGMADAGYAEDVRALYERVLELSRARQIAARTGNRTVCLVEPDDAKREIYARLLAQKLNRPLFDRAEAAPERGAVTASEKDEPAFFCVTAEDLDHIETVLL